MEEGLRSFCQVSAKLKSVFLDLVLQCLFSIFRLEFIIKVGGLSMKLFIFLVLSLLSNFSVYAVTPSQRDWNHLFSTLTIKPYKFPIELITGKTIPEAKVIAKASLLKYYNDRGEDYKKHMGVDYNPYTGSGLYEKIDKGLEQINTIAIC